MGNLNSAESVNREFEQRSARVARATVWVKILIAAAAALVTYLQIPKDGSATILGGVGIGATVLIFVATCFLLFVDQDPTKALEAGRKALEEARQVDAALDAFSEVRATVRRSNHLYGATMAMRGAIEQIAGTEPVKPKALAEGLLTVAKRSLLNAMGFDLNQHWTIGVYQAQHDSSKCITELVLIAHERTVNCSIENARRWREGVGAGGMAYASGMEVIIPDTATEAVGTLFRFPDEKQEDRERYRSIVAVPVLVGPEHEKWGVCIATSNLAGHFSPESAEGVGKAEAMRALAGMVALGLASDHICKESHGPVGADTSEPPSSSSELSKL